ncbi:alpha/beta hydrolase, partial [Nocardia sp. NPDC004604]|uniref:alpha/beta fold hydrolase n=1 Tax=Nocardia sp. NPDC004604 TaxID=3157013 RepID=UPI0033AD93C4
AIHEMSYEDIKRMDASNVDGQDNTNQETDTTSGVADESLVSPDTWHHDFALLSRPGNDAIQLALFRDYATNPPMYPALHEYLRRCQPPLLAVWGKGDEIFGPEGARAFAEDVPDAEIHLLDGGHFLLESAGDDVAELIRDFMSRATVTR